MRAIDKLRELHEISCDIVAIAKDKSGHVFFYYNSIPYKALEDGAWYNADCEYIEAEGIEFDSENWEECIVTVEDLPNYDVAMMSISTKEYNRLLEVEKKYNEIKSLLS